jgi:hypothetical protein
MLFYSHHPQPVWHQQQPVAWLLKPDVFLRALSLRQVKQL